MLEFKGKYGTANVMLDTFENDQAQITISQIYKFLNHPAFTNPISIMPDCHKGKGVVIGFTMKMSNKIIPNVIGVDINCALTSINMGKTLFNTFNRKHLDLELRKHIPFNTNIHNHKRNLPKEFYKDVNKTISIFQRKFNKEFKTLYTTPIIIDEDWLKEKCKKINMDYNRFINSVGTLGGGNHFIEISIDSYDDYWATIHSGSRQFGSKVATYHQRKAGKGELAYLEGDDMFSYLIDMVVAQVYADYNRQSMVMSVIKITNITPSIIISSSHNYIDFKDFIIRKGAVSAYKDDFVIIPFNMEDGILICKGKSNPDWNYSAPHGAGRVDSRRWAKENLNLEEAEQRMKEKDIYCSKLPIDETKKAYKDPQLIKDAIKPTVKIINYLRPVLACKG